MHLSTPHGARVPRRALLAVLAAACLAYLSFPGVWGWNENSRLALVMAAVDLNTLSIDRYHERPGTETGDKSKRDGRFYSDKAIGTALLGAPAYGLARPLLARFESVPERYAAFARTVVTWAAVSIPAALGVALLYALAWRACGDARWAAAVAACGALGTPLWPYATVLFGHATAAALLLGGFAAARAIRDGSPRPVALAAAAGGALAMAVVTEYPTGPVAALLGAYLLLALRPLPRAVAGRAVLAAAAVGALPIAALLAYNAAAFGSPFSLGYAHIAGPEFVEVHAQGLLGVGLPRGDRLVWLTVHPARGLFAQAPVLIAGLAGLWPMWRRGWRLEVAVILGALAMLLAIAAGFPVWWGGRSFGARHLVPAVLLACVPIAFLGLVGRRVALALLAASIVQMAIPTLVGPTTRFDDAPLARSLAEAGTLPWRGSSPIWNEGWAALRAGELRASLGTQAGLPRTVFLGALAVSVAGLFAFAARARREPPGARPTG